MKSKKKTLSKPPRKTSLTPDSQSDRSYSSAVSENCRVCFESLQNPQNFIVKSDFSVFPEITVLKCKGCGLEVHNYCYGIDTNTPDFRCDICSFKEQNHPKCLICGNTDLLNKVYKRLEKNQWIHAICGLTSTYILITDFRQMKMKLMTEEPKKVKFSNDRCSICELNSSSRDLIQCDLCTEKAHFYCLFIERIFSQRENIIDCYFWFKFSAFSLNFKKIWSLSEELFLEECEELRNEFDYLISKHRSANSKPKEEKPIENKDEALKIALKEIQKNVCNCENNTPNREFRCNQHEVLECPCGKPSPTTSSVIFCEYCNRWYHMSCDGVEVEPDRFICSQCRQAEAAMKSILGIFEKKDVNELTKLQAQIDILNDKCVRYLDMVILGSAFSLFLEHFEQSGQETEIYIKTLSEFAMRIPLNLEWRLMNALQNFMKNAFWDNYLIGHSIDVEELARSSCKLREKDEGFIEFDKTEMRNLEHLIINLRNMEKEVRGAQSDKRNKKIEDLENIWKARKIVKNVMSGKSQTQDKLLFLEEQAKAHPEMKEFQMALSRSQTLEVAFKEIENSIYQQILNAQNAAKVILMNKNDSSQVLDLNFFKMGKFTEEDLPNLWENLKRSCKEIQDQKSFAVVNGFCQKIEKDLKFLKNARLAFEKSLVREDEFEDFGLRSYRLAGWNKEVLEYYEKWLKWKKWNKKLLLFRKARSELCLCDYLFTELARDLELDRNPLLALCTSVSFESEPQISSALNLSLFKVLSLDFIENLITEGREIQENYQVNSFIDRNIMELQKLHDEGVHMQKLLKKIYRENNAEMPWNELMASLRKLNLCLPIYMKIWTLKQNQKEFTRLRNPATTIWEITKKLEAFMLKKLSFLTLPDLLKAKKSIRKFKRLLIPSGHQNLRVWLNFTNEIEGNLRLFKRIWALLIEENFGNPMAPDLKVILLKERLNYLLVTHRSNIVYEESPNNPLSELMAKLKNYHEIDHDPSLSIMLKDFPEILFELRFTYWISKLKEATSSGSLSIEHYIESKLYLVTFIEKLEIPDLQNRATYKEFKNLEKRAEEWIHEYELINRVFIEDQSLLQSKIEEFYMRLLKLKEKMPLKISICEAQINNLSIALEAAVKAKKTLTLMTVEKKELAFTCIETLYEFFNDQISKNPQALELLPFSKQIIEKYNDLKQLITRITSIQNFMASKLKAFKPFLLKMTNIKNSKVKNPNVPTLFLLTQKAFDLNPEGIYDLFQTNCIEYKELRGLIDASKTSGVDFKVQRSILTEIKKNTENFTLSIENMLKSFPYPDKHLVIGKENIESYFFQILSHRNHIYAKNIINSDSMSIFRIYEWAFYTLAVLSGRFWLLPEGMNPEVLNSNFKLLNSIEKQDSSYHHLNERGKMQRLLDEGMKNSSSPFFTAENRELLDILRAEITRFEKLRMQDFESYRQKYAAVMQDHQEVSELNLLEGHLRGLLKTYNSGRTFDRESLEFLVDQVTELETANTCWVSIKNEKVLQGITESMIRGLIWLKDFKKVGFFRELPRILQLIKQRFVFFRAKPSQKKYSRLLKLYKSAGLVIPEVDKLREDVLKDQLLLDELYLEFQDEMRTTNSLEIWGKLTEFKKRLAEEVKNKFTGKYQSFWIEILENQILCLKSLNSQGKRKTPKKGAMNGREDLMPLARKGGDYMRDLIDEDLGDAIVVKIEELREIEKESPSLSKPSREFLESFLKKALKMTSKKFMKVNGLLRVDMCSEESEGGYRKIRLLEFKRTRNLYRLKEALENFKGFNRKKADHLAQYVENRLYWMSCEKGSYEGDFARLLEKMRSFENGDIWKLLGVKIQKKDEAIIQTLKYEFGLFVRNDNVLNE